MPGWRGVTVSLLPRSTVAHSLEVEEEVEEEVSGAEG